MATPCSNLALRIKMLCQNVNEFEQQRLAVAHDNQMLRQHLEVQINAQRQAHEAYIALQQDNRQLQMSFDKLMTDNKELMTLVESFKSELVQQEKEKENRRRSNDNMEEMNRLAAEVIAAEEALSLKDDQLTEIRGQYNQIEEEVEILRIQSETYKSDFSCEREARTKLAQEKEELMEALQKCQEENLAYKEELKEINQRQFRELQGRLRSQVSHPPNYGIAEEQQGGQDSGQHLNDVGPNSAGPTTIGHPGEIGRYPFGAPALPQPMTPIRAPHYRSNFQDQMSGMHSNVPVPTLRPQWSYGTRPLMRYSAPQAPAQEQEPIRFIDDENGDGNLPSLMQYECPSCGALYPDSDSLQLHVPDCMDGR